MEEEYFVATRDDVVEFLRELSPIDMRRLLVDVYYLSSHYDDDMLRDALEPIIKAR